MKNLPLLIAASFIAALLAASIALGSQYHPAEENMETPSEEHDAATQESPQEETHAEEIH